MSTILDALRKIEEENRIRNADARTRLLRAPQQFALHPRRRQRISWLVSAGLIVGGIALGAGLMGWGWYAQSSALPVVTTANVLAPHVQTTPAPVPPLAALPPLPPEHVTPVATKDPAVIVISPSSAPEAAVDNDSTGTTHADKESSVQRSPFVNTSEPERIPPPPSPVEPRVATKVKPVKKPIPRVRVAQESAAQPSVDDAPAPLEEDNVAAEVPPSASPEEEEKSGTETSSPPTPASVSFLQWSPEPEKRMAFIKVGDKPTALAHEGDVVNGVTVVKIRQGAVELRSGESRWTLKAR
ncbi:MAG: hypothetical protein EXR78_10080 [Deltaproteobacteria bacterium]|nr:hypothetical protein [Deltaproteobacteria bacterium]